MENDVFKKLYDDIAIRKNEINSDVNYSGGNGRIDRAAEIILTEDFPKDGILLDVGGATGNLGFLLKNYFSKRFVIDITNECSYPAKKKGNEFYQENVDLTGLKAWAGCDISLITALDFIEHILNPEQFAKGCFNALKFGGKVLINTPNIQYWRHLDSLVSNAHFPHTSGDREVFHGGHVAFYNFFDLKNIFESTGFVNCKMHTEKLKADPPPPIWLNLAKYKDSSKHLSYPDLIFSCEKP